MIVRITSKFGEVSQVHPTPHTGIDIGFPEGSQLHSIGEAVVERVVDYGSQNIGKGVILRLADGREAIYGHMSDIKVKSGQTLHEGDIIGLSGNTGHSTGPHLHFGMKDNGQFVDPTSTWEKFIANGKVGDGIGDIPEVNGWKWIGEKVLGDGLQHWIADYIVALPLLVGISIGVWGLLNMVHSRLATWGVMGVFILGGLAVI
ncbi:M23 family metallopeptidase [Mesobacillus sp. S13]|uniref:M23 family metallopeptidase n=1 Tax=Mesobacillus sp. S13 TaxID=2880221 RepID=UPI001CF58524|nr:M23 family metallopeptidase [Mesobacillus sp. S13]